MNARMRALLDIDNYITGSRYRAWIEDLTCKECDFTWRAEMFEEYGHTYFKDDDNSVCPKCGKEFEW